MRELALFAGAGGGILGGLLLGWRTVCAVEIDAYCRSVLLHRQRDGWLEPFPVWDDVRTFDGRPWRGHVDVISGGFPCQDISSAGTRAGITGERSGLWSEFARIIGEVRPRFAFVENSPDLTTRGLGVVLGDLAALGFDARWDVLGARHVGAPHRRDRIWIVADAHGGGQRVCPEHAKAPGPSTDAGSAADTAGLGREGSIERGAQSRRPWGAPADPDAGNGSRLPPHPDGEPVQQQSRRRQTGPRWPEEAALARGVGWWGVDRFAGVADGVAHRMDRVRATGNGQVPRVAALAWQSLSGGEL